MKSLFIIVGSLLLCPFFGYTQNENQQNQHFESIDSVSHGSFNQNEAHSFKEWFKRGHSSGLIRINNIHTFRPESRTYYGALAVGGRLYYHTAYWNGLQLGLGGLYAYNIAATNLSAADHKFIPRWERQLFDLQDPSNKHDLDRLEELFVKYRHKDSYLKLGKMLVETPFVNPQDSRMKPSAFQGIWFDWNEGHRFEVNGGVFNKVSPRSTTEWIHISESIGLYDHYLDGDAASPIFKDINLWVLGGHVEINENFNFHNWQYYINRFSYVNFNQIEWRKSSFKIGLQYIFQKGLDSDQVFDQQSPNHQAHLVSAQLKWIGPKWQVSYNNTQNLSIHPFIFPKEWGAEPFYTFISRHRIEALNEVNSQAIKLDLQPINDWQDFNLGLYTAVTSYEAVDSFTNTKTDNYMTQISLDIRSRFNNYWENLSFRLLNTVLIGNEEGSNSFLEEEIFHSQLIVNYKF
jgi:hypothetical protein